MRVKVNSGHLSAYFSFTTKLEDQKTRKNYCNILLEGPLCSWCFTRLATNDELVIVLGWVCLVSLLWGNFWKFWIYKYFTKINIWDRPINILILLDVVIHHVCYSLSLIIVIMWIVTDTSAGNFLSDVLDIPISEKVFCKFNFYIGFISFHYDAIGSFGICLHR